MAAELIAVTGVTGALGGRIADRLAGAGRPPRLVVRGSPSRAPRLPGADVRQATYHNGESMRAALTGVSTLLLVSAGEHPDRVGLHRTAVDAAVQAGVSRIVYTSFVAAAPEATFTFARDHWHTEQHIASTGLAYTFLRNSLYLDLLPSFVGEDGVIRGPAGHGRVAAVARADIADVAVAVLLSRAHDGRTYDVTGREAVTLAEVADLLTLSTDRPVRYHAESIEEAYRSRAHYGAPDYQVTGWVTSYAAIANGELATVSATVDTVAGHPPASFAEYLASHPPAP